MKGSVVRRRGLDGRPNLLFSGRNSGEHRDRGRMAESAPFQIMLLAVNVNRRQISITQSDAFTLWWRYADMHARRRDNGRSRALSRRAVDRRRRYHTQLTHAAKALIAEGGATGRTAPAR